MEVTRLSSGEEDTLEIARAMGEILEPGDVVALTGDLGAGKPVFCKGGGAALGVPPPRGGGPRFTIARRHVVCHRLPPEAEARDIGLDEILSGDRVCVVEWAEKIRFLLPNDCIRVKFTILGGDRRRLSVAVPDDPRFAEFLSRVRPLIPGG